jgi:hypothetical protein
VFKLKEKEKPKEILQNITHAVEEGNIVKSSLHAWESEECRHLFDMVNDWVGLIECRKKPIEELCTQLNKMNAESQAIIDPVEQVAKFATIQIEDERLNALDESTRTTKKELHNFYLPCRLSTSNYNKLITFLTLNGRLCWLLSQRNPV